MKRLLVLAVIISCVCMGAGFARAQAIPTLGDVTLNVSPEYPAPFESVNLELVSYSVSVDTAKITWYVNGAVVDTGTGNRTYTVRMKGPGETVTVLARVEVNALQTFNKSITLQPNTMDLLWEAIDSYVPTFYRGKALPAAEGALRITALPSTRTASNLVYTWTRGGEISQNDSGFGRNALVLKNNFFDTETKVSVTATSPSGGYQAQSEVSIPRVTPFIRFAAMEGDTVSGYALNGGTLLAPRGQFLLIAEPFYISSRTGYHGTNYVWNYGEDKLPISLPEPPNALLIDPPTSTNSIPFLVKVSHARDLLQEASGKVTILFR